MDAYERKEVHLIVKKYARREGRAVIDQMLASGRVNRSALARSGIDGKQVDSVLRRLRVALTDYAPEG